MGPVEVRGWKSEIGMLGIVGGEGWIGGIW